MIYLDTNIFVYAAINNGQMGEKCRNLLTDIAENNKDACTSVVTWDEVVYAIWKKEGREKAVEEGSLFLRLPNITLLPANQSIMLEAQKLMQTVTMKPRDAIHAATALINNCTEIVSDDPDFDKVKEVKRRKIY